LGILAIPTILVYHGDQEITRRIGAQSPTALNALFEAALTSTPPILGSLTPVERLLRLIAALSLIALGWLSASSPLLYLVGIILLFSAIYDRCPIWRALAPRLKKALLRFVSNKHGQSTLN
jgi:thioredoxin 1